MTGDTAVEVPVVDNKVEDLVKSDKEVIAEEEKALIENKDEEKKDEPEKTEETKEEVPEQKKVPILQKLFGKKKDTIAPKADEAPKSDKEIKEDEDKPEKTEEEKKDETAETAETVQHKFKKMFSMKKTKKEGAEKVEKAEGEEKVEEGEEKKDNEKKEGEEAIEEVAEADVSATTAERKTLMQKLMTIKRDLMANKKEEKKEEDKVEEGEKKEVETKQGEEVEAKPEGEEEKAEETKDELGDEKQRPCNRVKKFFSMKRQRTPKEGEEKVEEEKKEVEETAEAGTSEEKKEVEETDGTEKIEKAEKVNLLKRLFGRKGAAKAEEKKEGEEEKKDDATVEEKIEEKVEEKVEEPAEPVEEVLMVHLANRTPVIPSISPMQLKLESWLKFHGVKYENTHDKDNLPALAYQPMQSNEYLAKLAEKHEKQMPMVLDAEQKNIHHAMISLADKNIHFAIIFWQCSNMDNIIKGYKINLPAYMNSKVPLPLLRLFFKNNFCKKGLRMVRSNGFESHTLEELETLAKNDLKVLAEMLGDKDFFFGASPSLLDLVVFSHLAQLTVVEESVACALRDHVKAEHENLVRLVDRMKDLTWADHWALATEQLDRNPHIPKPIVEEAKAIIEEVVEAATEEKPEEKVEETTEKAEETKEEAVEEKAAE